MPMVNGKKYPYTEQGKKEAAKARKKKMGGGYARQEMKHGGKAEAMPKAKPC
tara:strand:+ start:66 stop:221 length:156 start_codon:yes stop_codon:yes gene_type:complete